jgi:hypothetical protein
LSSRSRDRVARVVTNWGGCRLADVLTLDSFRQVLDRPTLVRHRQPVLIGVVGGARGACYPSAWRRTRKPDGWSRAVIIVLVPRRAGPARRSTFLWVFLFFPPLADPLDDRQRLDRLHRRLARLRNAAGLGLAAPVGPGLGGGAQYGATQARVSRDVTLR